MSSVELLPSKVTATSLVAVRSAPASATGRLSTTGGVIGAESGGAIGAEAPLRSTVNLGL